MTKPTLTALTLRSYIVAGLVTLALVLLGLLLLADHLALRAATGALAREVRIATPAMASEGCGQMMGAGRRGQALLDGAGCPLNGPMATRCLPWISASYILESGEGHGIGQLPWVPGQVVWAARVIARTEDAPRILVAWNRVDAIRAAAGATYGLVILATLLAFLVSLGLAMRTTRGVARVLVEVTASGERMAAGDFQVQLPEQPTAELDQLSRVVSELAQGLDATLADLRAEHQRLANLEGLQRQFVADASHELRAPLASIALLLDAGRDGLLRPEEQAALLGQLRAEIARLSGMVEGLLDLSRLESGRELVAPMPMELVPALDAVTAGFHGLPGAPVTVQAPGDLPMVLADPDAVHRMLRNLVENARRFTPPDGTILLWAETEATTVRMGVSDTGSGIAPEELPRIWDRFARAAQARADGTAGTGLGLAIVKALAEAQGGTVGAESEPGVRTTVWVRLPLAERYVEPDASAG
jgi:signal transduction histidine kinase